MNITDSVRTLPSVCPLDCPDTCSLSVGTDGVRILDVRGSKANPYTAGVICNKVARSYPEFVHGSGRLTQPLKRVGRRGGDAFAPISWDEALDLIHEGISGAVARHGPQTVLPLNYAGPHGELAGGSMDRRFFHKLGASLLARGQLCGIVRGSAYASLYGAAPGMPPEQMRHSDLVVVWGNNVTVSNLHLAREIQAARKGANARLIVVDPKRTRIAEQADLFIQIRPGTDVVLALAMAAELERRGAHDRAFIERWVDGCDAYMAHARAHMPDMVAEVCGIDRTTFDTFADWYCDAKTVGVSVGNGIERGRSGGSGLRAAMALQALTGNHGRLGAGVFAKPGHAFPKDTDRLQRPDLVPDGTRTINIVDVSRLLLDDTLDPPIKAVFIYNHNPVATHPGPEPHAPSPRAGGRVRGGRRRGDDGFDAVLRRRAAGFEPFRVCRHLRRLWALPSAESGSGHPPVGESLPNTEIFRRLAARFGFDDPMFRESDEALMDAAFLDDDPRLAGHRPSRLPVGSALAMTTVDGAEPVMCATVRPATASGRIELFSRDLEDRFGYGLPRYEPVERAYPLTIISPSSAKRTNATFGNCALSGDREEVEINPADAGPRGISDGDELRVYNDRGETRLVARITDAVLPGVLYTPKGVWLSASPTGQTVNALLDADIRTDIEDGACCNEAFCDAVRVA